MSYEKQTWADGDIITAEKLNHIEDGVQNGGPGYDVTTETVSKSVINTSITFTEKTDASGNTIYACMVNEGQPVPAMTYPIAYLQFKSLSYFSDAMPKYASIPDEFGGGYLPYLGSTISIEYVESRNLIDSITYLWDAENITLLLLPDDDPSTSKVPPESDVWLYLVSSRDVTSSYRGFDLYCNFPEKEVVPSEDFRLAMSNFIYDIPMEVQWDDTTSTYYGTVPSGTYSKINDIMSFQYDTLPIIRLICAAPYLMTPSKSVYYYTGTKPDTSGTSIRGYLFVGGFSYSTYINPGMILLNMDDTVTLNWTPA